MVHRRHGGMHVDGNPMLLSGYYKYFPDGSYLNEKTKCIIYPNPAQDYIRIESSSAVKFMEIINAQGKTVFSARPFKKQYFVDTHHLQDGIYIVEIETGDSDLFEKIMILK